MALLCCFLFYYVIWKLLEKNKLWRENRKIERQERGYDQLQNSGALLTAEQIQQNKQIAVERERQKREDQYRKDLEKQGYNQDLIAIILPQIMSGGKW